MRHFAAFILASVLVTGGWAKIYDSKIIHDDRPLIALSEGFGFIAGGEIICDLRITDRGDGLKLDRMGIFVSFNDNETVSEAVDTVPNACALDTWAAGTPLRFSDTGIDAANRAGTAFRATFRVENSTTAFLYFANCAGHPVSFSVHVEEFNIVMGQRNYLSVGDMELEGVYWVMFGLFTAITGAWCWVIWRNRQHAQRIHYLMGLLCMLKVLTLMSQAFIQHYVARTGGAVGWNIMFYIFTCSRGILFFTVIVLIGTGWSYMKPFLGERDKRILMVVIPLQVLANLAIIIVDETSPADRDWLTWRDIFHLVDIICCCAILFPIVWSIKNLREASHTDGKAARNLEKLTLFSQFYIVVVVYIYFTRIVVYLLESTLPDEYTWISGAADELATLAFYVWTAVSFSPAEANPYLKMRTLDEELEASEIELEQSRLLP